MPNFIENMNMIEHTIENLKTPKAIAEFARSEGVINMAENVSDQPCEQELEHLLQKHIIPYANVSSQKFGLLSLREAIASKTKKFYDYYYNPETEISISTGVKQSIFATILALLKEGDEVVIFEPAHKSYEAAINITGARPVFVYLKAPDFKIDWDDVHKVINAQTRMIIINSPHFPTGVTLSELDMIRLQKLINGAKIFILSDESFEHVVFDKEMHQSIALYPKLRERSIIVSSFNETLNVNNWHVGYCMAPEKIMKEIRRVISIFGEGVATPFQMSLAEFLQNGENYNKIADLYQLKRDLFISHLEGSAFKALPSKGTYFQLISLNGANDVSDIELCNKLIKEIDVATVPISYYYHQKVKSRFVRLNLSVPDEVIIDVANKLKIHFPE